MVAFIGDCTTKLRAAGYTGIISTVETVGTYQADPSLCGAVESVIHANIHPYFNSGTTCEQAGEFVVSQQNLLAGLCSKTVIISETGWPWDGGSDGDAVASTEAQSTAITSIKEATNGQCTFFSYSNDAWKPAGVQQYFGMEPPFCVRSN